MYIFSTYISYLYFLIEKGGEIQQEISCIDFQVLIYHCMHLHVTLWQLSHELKALFNNVLTLKKSELYVSTCYQCL